MNVKRLLLSISEALQSTENDKALNPQKPVCWEIRDNNVLNAMRLGILFCNWEGMTSPQSQWSFLSTTLSRNNILTLYQTYLYFFYSSSDQRALYLSKPLKKIKINLPVTNLSFYLTPYKLEQNDQLFPQVHMDQTRVDLTFVFYFILIFC